MLDSQTRAIYLEELRPPEGYTFDCAVATTFTLDLLTLLMAPLSLALFDVENRDDILKDPLLVLEALRSTSDNLSIFCQNGYISVPKKDSLLYSYLEKSVIPVSSRRGKGVFHPKVWALRYTCDKEVFYRFLCLSRNMTFDCSWDTIVSFEGDYHPRSNGYSKNKALSDFILSLEELAVNTLSDEHSKRLKMIAHEMHRVQFQVPSGFSEDYCFSPSGIMGYKSQTFPQSYDRVMVVSPFLTDDGLDVLLNKGTKNILVSRPESLDELRDETYNAFIENTSVYCLDDAVCELEGSMEEGNENKIIKKADEAEATVFNGLHAKIFHFNHGWHSTLINGSANATKPGLNGGNVEFMVQLTGKSSKVGIEQFTGEKDTSDSSFMKLLKPYKRFDQKPEINEDEKSAEKLIADIRNGLISLALKGEVFETKEKGIYDLILKSKKKIAHMPSKVSINAYPITVSRDDSVLVKASEKTHISFKKISLQALTTFIAFEIIVKTGKKQFNESFVMNIPAKGIPEERNNSILVSIIKDRGRFIRYLLLILMDDPDAFMLEEMLSKVSNIKNDSSDNRSFIDFEIPLMEELVRAFSREPDKLIRIGRLIDDIMESGESENIIPPEFIETWATFMEAYRERIV